MKLRILVLGLVAVLPATSHACAVCMGDPNSAMARASNSVLWMLLGMVGFIFISTGATAFYLWRRSRAEIPADVQLVENLAGEPDEP